MGADVRDAELVTRYLETRDLGLFEELVARHRDRMMRLVLSVLGPDLGNDAEDVVQEAFLKAHDRLASFRGQSRFGSWLYRIAYNRSLDYRRSAARRQRRAREAAADPAGPPRVDGAGGQWLQISERKIEQGGKWLLTAERDRVVRATLDRVPQPYQTALHSYYWLELPVAEIAELLGVAPGTVKSYLHRGRARLARLLEEAPWFEEARSPEEEVWRHDR